MLDLIDLTDWKKKKEIIKELSIETGITIDERGWRLMVEKHNKLYFEHETDLYIAHSSKGYKVTNDADEIRASAFDYKKRALDQLAKYSYTLKALGENANMTVQIKNNELVVVDI